MRIKISFPSPFIYLTHIRVRISDINYGGHVGNDAFLSIAHEARIGFFWQWQMTEMNCFGVGLIMADAALQYKAEAFHGDMLKVEIAVETSSNIGFDMYYKISCQRQEKKLDIAYIKTGMICYDYETKRTLAIPEALLLALEFKQ
jgi:acyl-CoA thioester hydrolase